MKNATRPRILPALFPFPGTFLSAALAACVLVGAAPRAEGADAGEAVRAFLAKQGIQEGYDAARNRFVFVGDCAREVPDLAAPDFVKTRELAFLVAVLSAKRELIGALERKVSVGESVSVEDKDGETKQTTMSVVDVFSRRLVRGCTVLRAEESYDEGIYRTAVAVAWSEKLEAAALAAFSGADAGTTPAENDAEWAAWAKRTDFARRIGPAQFTDSRGVYRYAGIGCADVEGKTGKALLAAMKVAEKKAEQSLVYSLWADTAAHDRAVSIVRERASADGEETEAEEDFVSRISQDCAGRRVRKRKVFAGEVPNPLTGRKMFVYVAGVDPAVLAELEDEED
jgi:hypothetical protein